MMDGRTLGLWNFGRVYEGSYYLGSWARARRFGLLIESCVRPPTALRSDSMRSEEFACSGNLRLTEFEMLGFIVSSRVLYAEAAI